VFWFASPSTNTALLFRLMCILQIEACIDLFMYPWLGNQLVVLKVLTSPKSCIHWYRHELTYFCNICKLLVRAEQSLKRDVGIRCLLTYAYLNRLMLASTRRCKNHLVWFNNTCWHCSVTPLGTSWYAAAALYFIGCITQLIFKVMVWFVYKWMPHDATCRASRLEVTDPHPCRSTAFSVTSTRAYVASRPTQYKVVWWLDALADGRRLKNF